ncbi:MAG: tetratricopeptide repeat protein [Variovorax sp.]|nr:tetratricopeptide repeat protein [Variovorax sp.]
MSTTPAPEAFEQARQRFFEGLEAFETGRFADAEQAYLASLALVPGRISTLLNLVATQLRLGRPQHALGGIEQILSVEPDNAEAWFHKGNAFGQLNQHPEALTSYEKVLRLGTLPPAEPWLRHGQTLQALGRPEQALDSYDRALAAGPGIAQAWTNRGSILRDMKRSEEAAAAFRQALALGADPELHHYYLAAVSVEQATPPTAPGHYVETLFDDYAHEFDAHLVGQLGYKAHRTLTTHLAGLGRGFRSAVDLGCGTGLCAPYLKPIADKLVGVDLSSQMLQKAQALGLYERLVHADIVAYLAQTDEQHDLVTAADVFIYVGDLAPVFAALDKTLEPGGIFCFSAESAADENSDFELLPSLRYAHSERYLRGLAARHGLDVVRVVHAPIRDDQREAIAGMFVYLRRPEGLAEPLSRR